MARTYETVLWCGEPLNEVPREKLERALIDAEKEIRRLQLKITDMAIDHLGTIAKARRQRRPWLFKLFDVLAHP